MFAQRRVDVRNRSQPFATVLWPCLLLVLQKGTLLEVSHVALLRFAWQAWHFVTFRRFCNVSKMVLCGRRNTFPTFSEDALQFSWLAQHFRRVVLRCFLCESHCQGCVRWRQGANSVVCVAFCEM